MTIWMDYVFDGRTYGVSDDGRVRTDEGRVLKLTQGSTGYLYAHLRGLSKARKCATAHSLVAHCFHGPRPKGLQVRHLDGDPLNNRADNLAYGTARQNAQDAKMHGTLVRGQGFKNARLTDRGVAAIRRLNGFVPLRVMADAMGASISIVSQAARRETWQHIEDHSLTWEEALRAIWPLDRQEKRRERKRQRGLDPFEIADRLYAEYRGQTPTAAAEGSVGMSEANEPKTILTESETNAR